MLLRCGALPLPCLLAGISDAEPKPEAALALVEEGYFKMLRQYFGKQVIL